MTDTVTKALSTRLVESAINELFTTRNSCTSRFNIVNVSNYCRLSVSKLRDI